MISASQKTPIADHYYIQESEPKAVRKEVDHAAFDSLEGDNAGPSSSQSTVPKQTSRKPAGLEGKEPKPVLSSKPLAEQKRVIRLMFRKVGCRYSKLGYTESPPRLFMLYT